MDNAIDGSRMPIVNCDVHPLINHLNATCRLDSVPTNSGPAGSDPAFTMSDHSEPHGITTAFLLPQEHYDTA